MQFSNSTTNLGIVERTRVKCGVDSTQWATANITGSCNDCMDFLAGEYIKADRRFQWDDTNHTKLPIGTTNLVAPQSDYSFLTDEQGNTIINLTRIDIKDSAGNWTRLEELDETEETKALDEVVIAGTPTGYYKIANNIIRLNRLPESSVTSGLKFYFQRRPSYFVATDTTKEPGFTSVPHSIFVTWASYDCADSLNLQNAERLFRERELAKQMVVDSFAGRNTDISRRMAPAYHNTK
jgi:hypothetical protein